MVATAAAPAAHAAPKAASTSCPTAEIIGVHGTGEGPSATDPKKSPEIKATFDAFTVDGHKLGEHGAQTTYYPYPTVSPADYGSSTGRQKVLKIVDDYAGELEAELETFSYDCPDTPISLIGYSLGAVLINNMLSSYDNEWNDIDAVELYGDPCWYNPNGGYRGLAQYAAKVGFQLGCFPENAYPYPLVSPTGFHFLVQSLCNNEDPVCGQGWPLYEIGGQIDAAKNCIKNKCPHLLYIGAATNYGAEFLAENAFKPLGAAG